MAVARAARRASPSRHPPPRWHAATGAGDLDGALSARTAARLRLPSVSFLFPPSHPLLLFPFWFFLPLRFPPLLFFGCCYGCLSKGGGAPGAANPPTPGGAAARGVAFSLVRCAAAARLHTRAASPKRLAPRSRHREPLLANAPRSARSTTTLVHTSLKRMQA